MMRAINLTVLASCLFISTAILAQNKNDEPGGQERIFKKFRVDIAGSGIRFIGEKEAGIKHSKTGYGGYIQPAWNITDNHSLGLKMLWSEHDEQNGTEHFSLLANYMYTYFGGPHDIPDRIEELIAFYGGAGIGFTNGPSHKNDSTVKNNSNKTSFAFMPYFGIRYGPLFMDAHYHLAAGNKLNTYFGLSAGLIFGGGLRHDSSKKLKRKS